MTTQRSYGTWGTGRELRTLNGHTKTLSAVAFSPWEDIGNRSWDKTVKLWDVSSGRELRTLTGHSDLVDAVAFTGNFLVTGSADRLMRCSEENNCDREFKAAYSQPPVKPARRSPLSM